ncbi:MAG: hypothetical protein ACI399_06105 [Candidatus Cryptobacteroides sp.]
MTEPEATAAGMRQFRNIFIRSFLPLLFLWYISGISLFPHTHIVDGVRIVHSHPNPDAEHADNESVITISMLSHFDACGAGEVITLPFVAFLLIGEICLDRGVSSSLQRHSHYFMLRAPPGALFPNQAGLTA